MELAFKRFKSSKWLPDGRIQVRLHAVIRDESTNRAKTQTVNLVFSTRAELQAFAESARVLEPMPPGRASANAHIQQTADQVTRQRPGSRR
jgi:hypothetical protein